MLRLNQRGKKIKFNALFISLPATGGFAWKKSE